MSMTEATPATRWWCDAVVAAREGRPAPALPEAGRAAVEEFAARHRLEPLLHAWGVGGDCRSAYWSALARGEAALREGLRVWQSLEEAGIPTLPLRGPFTGHRWYGDAGARWFTDLDLLVSRGQLGRARRVIARLGYDRRQPRMPDAFYRAVHLHYPLHHRERGVLLDLHWAVDHPFVTHRVGYPELFAESILVESQALLWRVPSSVHDVLLQVAHLLKECGPGPTDSAAAWAQAARSGQLLGLLDLALMVHRVEAEGRAGELVATAARWGLADAVSTWASAARQPAPWADEPRRPAVVSRWETLGGFRAQRWPEVRSYLQPPPEGSWSVRLWHRLRAMTHVGWAGAVAATCLLASRRPGLEKCS